MSSEIIVYFIILQYLTISICFLLFQVHLKSLSRSILLALRSPKNKAKIEEQIKKFETESKLFIFWPLFFLKKLKNELVNRK